MSFLLVTTGGAGFLLGALVKPSWQVSVESGQALAGLVTYPAGNAFYIYHLKLWTIVNQLSALALTVGFSERTLSILVSGAIAALSYCAVGLCAFATSRNAWWAIAAPFLLDFTQAREALAVTYPMDFMGTPHTYGVVGLAWTLLTISLLALERYTAGGIFLGLAPAVHPSMGAWCWLTLLLVFAWSGRRASKMIRGVSKSACVGLAIAAASFLTQFALMRNVVPEVDPQTQARFVSEWVSFFDYHRRKIDFGWPGVRLTMAAAVIALYLIPLWNAARDRATPFLLRIIVVASAVALLAAAISRLPASSVPPRILMLMPTRVFLLANLTAAAALFGVLGRFPAVGSRIGPRRGESASRWIGVLAGVVLAAFIGQRVIDRVRSSAGTSAMVDYTSSPVLASASTTPGLILVGTECCALTQLRTRRPVLVETGGLDQIMYAPESAPAMNEALKAVYGVDLLRPQEILRSPAFNEDLTPVTRPLWEARSPEEWKNLADAFGFTAVLTNPNWTLKLPEVRRDSEYALYRLPP